MLPQWIDIDRPMIVDLRDRIFRRPAPGSSSSQYMLRTLDISQKGWTRDIPKPAAGQPTLVVAEGQFCYLEPATVYNILNEVVEYFGTGQIAFDKLGTLAVTLTSRVKFLKASRATFTWAVDDPREIEDMCPRLRLKECIDKKKFMVSPSCPAFSLGLVGKTYIQTYDVHMCSLHGRVAPVGRGICY